MKKKKTADTESKSLNISRIGTLKEGPCSMITIAEKLLMAGTRIMNDPTNDETSSALITRTIVRSSLVAQLARVPRMWNEASCVPDLVQRREAKVLGWRRNERF